MKNTLLRVASVATLLLVMACSKTPDAASTGAASQAAQPGFINKVWEVSLSTGVAPGTLYVFLSDGTLVITSPHSQAAVGAWTYQGGMLTMVEASIEYKVDILGLSQDELRIRSRHPGGSVEIMLVPAKIAPLGPSPETAKASKH